MLRQLTQETLLEGIHELCERDADLAGDENKEMIGSHIEGNEYHHNFSFTFFMVSTYKKRPEPITSAWV